MVIVDETESLVDGASCVELLSQYSNLIVLRSVVDLSAEQSRICVFALSAESVMKKLSSDVSSPQDTETLEGILTSLLNTRETMRRKQVIRENKTLLGIKLRNLGIEIHDTNSDSILVRAESPLDLQIALEENGILAWNCVGLPQLGGFLRIPLSDDESARSLIDTIERLPRNLFQETQETKDSFDSTITVNRTVEVKH